jgi:hypothetical protein
MSNPETPEDPLDKHRLKPIVLTEEQAQEIKEWKSHLREIGKKIYEENKKSQLIDYSKIPRYPRRLK